MDRLLREGIEVFPVGENKHIRPDTLTLNIPCLVHFCGGWFRTGDWGRNFLDAAGGRRPTAYRQLWSVVKLASWSECADTVPRANRSRRSRCHRWCRT